MKCDKEMVLDWLNNQLTETQRKAFEQHLAECASCRQQVSEVSKTLDLMEEVHVPGPSPRMQANFQEVLDSYKQSVTGSNTSSWSAFINNLYMNFRLRPQFQLAYSIVLLLLGFLIGYLLINNRPAKNDKQDIAALSLEVQEMKRVMMLSLLENPSATKRLRAVSYTEEIGNVNDQVIEALLATLNEDPNVNVRLTTLEALTRYSDNPKVRQGLVESIVHQESPLVQSALADVMLQLQEKKAIESLKTLLEGTGPDNPVRDKIQKTINKLTS